MRPLPSNSRECEEGKAAGVRLIYCALRIALSGMKSWRCFFQRIVGELLGPATFATSVDLITVIRCSGLNDLTVGVLDSGVFGADMRCEFLVALLFVVTSHLIYRVADGRTCHLEHPCTLGATPAPKIRPFDPCQFAAHLLQSTPPNLARFGASHHAEPNQNGPNTNDSRMCCLWGIRR